LIVNGLGFRLVVEHWGAVCWVSGFRVTI